jgi:FAD/FMN-containing dehydrogenase
MMIDLSQMRQVSVNAQRQRARAQGGALLSDLDTATLAQNLVTTAGVVSHTGVAGFTLGGGFGNLNRKFGLAVDNLVSAEIVTADGKVRRVSAEQEPDLFWAIRGGGGNFGVVTEFEFQLHPFNRQVLAGNVVWPLTAAKDVLDYYAEWSERLSDDMYAGPILLTPPDGPASLVMSVLYNGNPATGEQEIARLRKIGKPVQDGVKVQDYMVTQTQSDGAFHHGVRSYAKNGMVKKWSKDLINAMIEANDPRVFLGTHVAGGAVKRVGELDTAFPHRNAEVMLVIVAAWEDPKQDEEHIAAARAYFKAIEPYTGGYYDNIDFDRSAAASNYGPAYERLSRIKGQVDPSNQFRLNSNIQPAV